MTEDDLVIDRELEDEDEQEKSGSSSSKTTREDVIISSVFGSKRYREDQDCSYCGDKSDGVSVVGGSQGFGGEMPDVTVVCDTHRAVVAREAEVDFKGFEWHPFEEKEE